MSNILERLLQEDDKPKNISLVEDGPPVEDRVPPMEEARNTPVVRADGSSVDILNLGGSSQKNADKSSRSKDIQTREPGVPMDRKSYIAQYENGEDYSVKREMPADFFRESVPVAEDMSAKRRAMKWQALADTGRLLAQAHFVKDGANVSPIEDRVGQMGQEVERGEGRNRRSMEAYEQRRSEALSRWDAKMEDLKQRQKERYLDYAMDYEKNFGTMYKDKEVVSDEYVKSLSQEQQANYIKNPHGSGRIYVGTRSQDDVYAGFRKPDGGFYYFPKRELPKAQAIVTRLWDDEKFSPVLKTILQNIDTDKGKLVAERLTQSDVNIAFEKAIQLDPEKFYKLLKEYDVVFSSEGEPKAPIEEAEEVDVSPYENDGTRKMYRPPSSGNVTPHNSTSGDPLMDALP